MEAVVIIGSGPAGSAAALYAARAGRKPLWITGAIAGGLLSQIAQIENYPGFVDGISGYELSEKMIQHAENAGARLVFSRVEKISFAPGSNRIFLSDGKEIAAQSVILALGTRHSPLNLPDEQALTGHGVSYCATCDGPLFRNKRVAVAGTGDIAIEEALMLAQLASEVHFISRPERLFGTQVLVDRLAANPKLTLHLDSTVTALAGADTGRLTGVTISHPKSGAPGEMLELDALFVAMGQLLPNTDLLKETALELDNNGYIKLTDCHSCATTLPGVFAAGDCACPAWRQVVIAAGMGAAAAMAANAFLNRL